MKVKNFTIYLQLLIGLLVLGLGLYFILYRTEGFKDNLKNRFVMYKVDWCPHCKKAQPTFLEMKTKMKALPVSFEIVDCEGTEEERQLCKNEKISGYPTFKFHSAKETKEYHSVLTLEALKFFFSNNL